MIRYVRAPSSFRSIVSAKRQTSWRLLLRKKTMAKGAKAFSTQVLRVCGEGPCRTRSQRSSEVEEHLPPSRRTQRKHGDSSTARTGGGGGGKEKGDGERKKTFAVMRERQWERERKRAREGEELLVWMTELVQARRTRGGTHTHTQGFSSCLKENHWWLFEHQQGAAWGGFSHSATPHPFHKFPTITDNLTKCPGITWKIGILKTNTESLIPPHKFLWKPNEFFIKCSGTSSPKEEPNKVQKFISWALAPPPQYPMEWSRAISQSV